MILKTLFVYGLFVVACFGGEDERKLYSGSIAIPALGELEMSLSVVESEMGTTLLMTVPSQGAVEIPLQTTHNKNGGVHDVAKHVTSPMGKGDRWDSHLRRPSTSMRGSTARRQLR